MSEALVMSEPEGSGSESGRCATCFFACGVCKIVCFAVSTRSQLKRASRATPLCSDHLSPSRKVRGGLLESPATTQLLQCVASPHLPHMLFTLSTHAHPSLTEPDSFCVRVRLRETTHTLPSTSLQCCRRLCPCCCPSPPPPRPEFPVLCVGMGGAGKSTLLAVLSGEESSDIQPTMGQLYHIW